MKKTGLLIILCALLVLVALNSFYTVEENQFACIVRFSEIIFTTDTAGLHFKVPFIDTISYFSKATQFYDIPPSEVLTSDKQNMTADCYVLWRIEDPKKFYQTLGTTGVAEQRLDAITYNELKNVMGTLAQADIINMEDGAKRNEIYKEIQIELAEDIPYVPIMTGVGYTLENAKAGGTIWGADTKHDFTYVWQIAE